MRILEHHGLIVDGHDVRRADVLAQAADFLIGLGVSVHDVEDRLIDRPGLIARAWWGGDERGFVQEHHDGAEPVTVVNVDVSP